MAKRLSNPLIPAAAIALGGLVALALPAGAALSVQSESPSRTEVKLGNQATLDAKGAVVFAPISIVCQPGAYTYLSVSVTQVVGGGNIASGTTTSDALACTGSVQKLNVAVTPTQKAFRKGVAFGQAKLHVCHVTCHTAVDEHNIEIVRK